MTTGRINQGASILPRTAHNTLRGQATHESSSARATPSISAETRGRARARALTRPTAGARVKSGQHTHRELADEPMIRSDTLAFYIAFVIDAREHKDRARLGIRTRK